MKKEKTQCLLKTVWLMRNGREIDCGNMTVLARQLPKTRVLKDENGQKVRNEKGKIVRVPVHYTKEEYEQWQHKTSNLIVERLNDGLPAACVEQKTMYYFTKDKLLKVAL